MRSSAPKRTGRRRSGRPRRLSRQAIIAVENGKYDPALPLAFRIARAFEKNVEDVFLWEVGPGES